MTAAVEHADAHGLAALTIRAVATALGSSPMAIYRHVSSRDDLVLLMTDQAFGRPPGPLATAATWQEAVRAWTSAMLHRYERHPWLTEAIFASLIPSANRARWLEALLGALSTAPLASARRLDAALLFDGHARNIATLNHATRQQDATRTTPESLLALMDPTEFPHLREVISTGALNDDQTQDGSFGIDRLIAGLEATPPP